MLNNFCVLNTGKELSAKSKTYEYTGESDEEEGIETTIELRGVSLNSAIAQKYFFGSNNFTEYHAVNHVYFSIEYIKFSFYTTQVHQ